MSDFFSVEVSAVDGAIVDLGVTIIHPDIAKVRTTATFALSLLIDPLRESPWCEDPAVVGSALARRFGTDSRPADEDIQALACGFVRSVEMTEQVHHPPPDSWDQPEQHRAFWEGEDRPAVTLRVSVSDPAWIQHLRPGMRWRSAAYSLGDGAPWAEPGILSEHA